MRVPKVFRSLSYGLRSILGKAVISVFLLGTAVQAAPITIVALGDSLTQGYGLQAQDGFVPVLEGWLREQGADVVVQNAGVSGDTSAGGLERTAWALSGPADAVIIAFGGNDMLRGFPPALMEQNLSAIIEQAQGRGLPVLLVGIEASLNYGQGYKDQFDAVYAALGERYGVAVYDNFLAAIARDRTIAEIQQFMQADGLHPSPEGVMMIVQDMGPAVLNMIAEIDPS